MTSSYERVARAIGEDILARRLRPGERLPDETELAGRYEVGRSTVREALRLLAGRGWLRSTRGTSGGVFVTQPEPLDVGRELGSDLAFLVGGGGIAFTELVEARHLYEETAARLATRRAGPAEIERIHRLAHDALDLLDDPAAFTDTNIEFHAAITEAAHNRVLVVWAGAMQRVLADKMKLATETREGRRHAAEQHVRIAEAIRTGDPELAARCMADHLNDFEADYLRRALGN